MKNNVNSPVDVLCRELDRLDNDADRLQMLVTLKSHLNHLQLTPDTLQYFFSIFNDEQYRLKAIYQLIPSVRIIFHEFFFLEYRIFVIRSVHFSHRIVFQNF